LLQREPDHVLVDFSLQLFFEKLGDLSNTAFAIAAIPDKRGSLV
jgi:hypothetical protein